MLINFLLIYLLFISLLTDPRWHWPCWLLLYFWSWKLDHFSVWIYQPPWMSWYGYLTSYLKLYYSISGQTMKLNRCEWQSFMFAHCPVLYQHAQWHGHWLVSEWSSIHLCRRTSGHLSAHYPWLLPSPPYTGLCQLQEGQTFVHLTWN